MSPAILEIDVTLTPDDSLKNRIRFSFSSTSPCLDDEEGNITLPPNGRETKIRFHLVTKTITWAKGPHVGTFNVGLLTGKDAAAEETLWIWPRGADKKKALPEIYSRYEFCDGADGTKHRHVCVHSANSKKEQHDYGLAVGIEVAKDTIEVVRNDPRIRNGGTSID